MLTFRIAQITIGYKWQTKSRSYSSHKRNRHQKKQNQQDHEHQQISSQAAGSHRAVPEKIRYQKSCQHAYNENPEICPEIILSRKQSISIIQYRHYSQPCPQPPEIFTEPSRVPLFQPGFFPQHIEQGRKKQQLQMLPYSFIYRRQQAYKKIFT